MNQSSTLLSSRLCCAKRPRTFLLKCLCIFALALLAASPAARAVDPFGATPHADGTTTFRVWAPFVDEAGVKINGGAVVLLAKEPRHTDPADTVWVGTVPGATAGDKYRYSIRRGGTVREFNDPRAQQLTGFDLPNGFGLILLINKLLEDDVLPKRYHPIKPVEIELEKPRGFFDYVFEDMAVFDAARTRSLQAFQREMKP